MSDLESLQHSMDEVKTDMREVKTNLNQLVRVEERMASVLKISENNSKQIGKMWDHLDSNNSDIGELRTKLAIVDTLSGFQGKLVWAIVLGVTSICASILGSTLL
jgi:hypothetical protein